MNRTKTFTTSSFALFLALVSWGLMVAPGRANQCHNGITESPETCDDVHGNSSNGCNPLCLLTTPANTTCAAASTFMSLDPGLFATSGNNTMANVSAAPGCGATLTRHAWFTYTAECTGWVALHPNWVDMGSPMPDVATIFSPNSAVVLTAFDSCGGSELACNNSAVSGSGTLLFPVVTGEDYKVRLSSIDSSSGNYFLRGTCNSYLPNDLCSTATPVVEGSPAAEHPYASVGAPFEDAIASCGGGGFNDIWFSYTPSCTGAAYITTVGTLFDHVLSTYDSCGGQEMGCATITAPGYVQLYAPVIAGVEIKLRLAHVDGPPNNDGPYSLQISCIPPPANDICANAAVAVDGTNAVNLTATEMDGSNETTCGFASSSSIFDDVWFDYVATCSGALLVDTCGGGSTNTRLAVYEGCDCSQLGAPIECNDNAGDPGDPNLCAGPTIESSLVTLATSGQCYKIRVGTVAPSVVLPLDNLRIQCQAAICGDGTTQIPEECDDNNFTNGDGCSSTCGLEIPAGSCATAVSCFGSQRDNACNCASCDSGTCAFSCARYGNTNCAGNVDLNDILCTLSGFSGYTNCPDADIAPCEGDGIIGLDDILGTLTAFSGGNPCGCAANDTSAIPVPPLCGASP